MAHSYSTGKNALGQCNRCGVRKKLRQLRPDGDTKLLVCGECYDIEHPAETPVRVADAFLLRRPAPDLDATNANVITDARPLGEVLFGTESFFGEQP